MISKDMGEQIAAAICHLMAADPVVLDPDGEMQVVLWPWDAEAWVPYNDGISHLHAARALIDAEIAQWEVRRSGG